MTKEQRVGNNMASLELNLKNFIAEIRETIQAFDEFADRLEQIDEKYTLLIKEKGGVTDEPTDDCVAIDFSTDIDKPNKWQSKDGQWHMGIIPMQAVELGKCENCEYYTNPDYTRCHECKVESEG